MFFRYRPRWSCFHGRVSSGAMGDAGYTNYVRLVASGYRVRVMFNGKEIQNCLIADPDLGYIELIPQYAYAGAPIVQQKGLVEVQIIKDKGK